MKMIAEVAETMKVAFMGNYLLANAYGFPAGGLFDAYFPASSVEANIINVLATSMATVSWQQESYEQDIRQLILQKFPGTIAWYHDLIMSYQYHEEQLVYYAAIVEQYPSLLIKVNAADFAVLGDESDQMTALRAYVRDRKFAGTHISIVSRAADDVLPTIAVDIDAQLYSSQGTLLADGTTPVEAAIDAYLASIVYNGTMNKTKLLDAIQAVPGVLDVTLHNVEVTREDGQVVTVSGNNYNSYGGAFVSTLKNITYVLS
jgi:hypothetical protein